MMGVEEVVLMMTILGALCRLLFPYLIKVHRDPNLKFDVLYVYSMILSIIVSSVTVVPVFNEINVINLITAFCAGYGTNSIVSRGWSNALHNRKHDNKQRRK